ncbi:TPA: hypothetical protein ACH3X3_013671 [Trebouxia sp. C0006]
MQGDETQKEVHFLLNKKCRKRNGVAPWTPAVLKAKEQRSGRFRGTWARGDHYLKSQVVVVLCISVFKASSVSSDHAGPECLGSLGLRQPSTYLRTSNLVANRGCSNHEDVERRLSKSVSKALLLVRAFKAESRQHLPPEFTNCQQSLLSLPDQALEAVARHLSPRSLAALSSTCHHLQGLIMQEALWQETLQACYPVWAASGVSAAPAGCGPTWRQLVAAAIRLQPPGLHDNSHMWPNYSPVITKRLWNSGLEGSKLDFYLCHAIHAADQQASMGFVSQEEVLSARLNFVCFLLFSRRQLARAAKILMQVVKVLATIMQPGNHGNEPETILQYNGWDTTRVAASAGSFLVELLHMRTARTSPMSVKSPQDFLDACQDPTLPQGAARLPETDTLSGMALSISWMTCKKHWLCCCHQMLFPISFCQSSMKTLSELPPGHCATPAVRCFWAPLLQQQLLSGPGADDLSQAVRAHGYSCTGSGQCLRAVQCFKMYFVMNPVPVNVTDTAAEDCISAIADQYGYHWQATGDVSALYLAMDWTHILVQLLTGDPDRARLAEHLESTCRLLCYPGCSSNNGCLILCIGACVFALRQLGCSADIISWVQDHAQMAEAAEQAFVIFLYGSVTAKEESLSIADALQQQHTLGTFSSQANAKTSFLSHPADLAQEHTRTLRFLCYCLFDLAHTAAAESIMDTVSVGWRRSQQQPDL